MKFAHTSHRQKIWMEKLGLRKSTGHICEDHFSASQFIDPDDKGKLIVLLATFCYMPKVFSVSALSFTF